MRAPREAGEVGVPAGGVVAPRFHHRVGLGQKRRALSPPVRCDCCDLLVQLAHAGRKVSDFAMPWTKFASSRHPCRERPLLELVLDLVKAGAGAGVVEIAARRSGGADRSDHLVAYLDDDTPAQQKQMRQLE